MKKVKINQEMRYIEQSIKSIKASKTSKHQKHQSIKASKASKASKVSKHQTFLCHFNEKSKDKSGNEIY